MSLTFLDKTQNSSLNEYSVYSEANTMLENGMNNYWQQRSSSYSDQNMAQLFSEKRTAWENLIFSHGRERKI